MTTTRGTEASLDAETQQALLRAIGSIRYGTVEVTIHNGRVVQIERREKIRLSDSDANRSRPQD